MHLAQCSDGPFPIDGVRHVSLPTVAQLQLSHLTVSLVRGWFSLLVVSTFVCFHLRSPYRPRYQPCFASRKSWKNVKIRNLKLG